MLIFVNRAPVHGSNIFPFESNSTALDENDKKTVLISYVKNYSRGSLYLKRFHFSKTKQKSLKKIKLHAHTQLNSALNTHTSILAGYNCTQVFCLIFIFCILQLWKYVPYMSYTHLGMYTKLMYKTTLFTS